VIALLPAGLVAAGAATASHVASRGLHAANGRRARTDERQRRHALRLRDDHSYLIWRARSASAPFSAICREGRDDMKRLNLFDASIAAFVIVLIPIVWRTRLFRCRPAISSVKRRDHQGKRRVADPPVRNSRCRA
jgi:hypothetical protein